MRDEYYEDEISYDDIEDSWQDEDDAWEEPVEQEPRRVRGLPGRHRAQDRQLPQRGARQDRWILRRDSDEDRQPRRHGSGSHQQLSRRSPGQSETTQRPTGTTSPMTDLLLLLFKVGLIVVFVLVLMTFFYGITQVRDESMNPAFKEGDLVIYYRLDKDYASQDAIVVDYNGTLQVRRVVAVAGDTVDISADGGLIINGSTQIEDEIYTTTLPYTDGITFPVTVGEGEVFVLGDDRTRAEDSRIYGTVSISATKGAVMTLIRRRGL